MLESFNSQLKDLAESLEYNKDSVVNRMRQLATNRREIANVMRQLADNQLYKYEIKEPKLVIEGLFKEKHV